GQGGDGVVERRAEDGVGAPGGGEGDADRVLGEVHEVVAGAVRAGHHDVGAGPEVEHVVAVAASELVVPRAAGQRVVAGPVDQDVVAAPAVRFHRDIAGQPREVEAVAELAAGGDDLRVVPRVGLGDAEPGNQDLAVAAGPHSDVRALEEATDDLVVLVVR